MLLMAKADTEQRQLAGEALDNGQRDAGLVGGCRDRGKDDALGRQASICSTLSSSLRTTLTSVLSSPKYCTRLW